MDPDVINFAGVAIIIVGLVASLCTIGLVAYRYGIRPVQKSRPIDNDSLQRLEQLQQSVDSIAIEVERIAEAQRFTAKLMAERPVERASLNS